MCDCSLDNQSFLLLIVTIPSPLSTLVAWERNKTKRTPVEMMQIFSLIPRERMHWACGRKREISEISLGAFPQASFSWPL